MGGVVERPIFSSNNKHLQAPATAIKFSTSSLSHLSPELYTTSEDGTAKVRLSSHPPTHPLNHPPTSPTTGLSYRRAKDPLLYHHPTHPGHAICRVCSG